MRSILSRRDTDRLEMLEAALGGPLRRVQQHPVYAAIVTVDDLRVFMEHHVWAVWDFMNLVKAIQQRYTAMTIPWVPRGDATVRRYVNEIVLEEESDEHPFDGEGFCSHFELYVGSMAEAGASTAAVERFVGAGLLRHYLVRHVQLDGDAHGDMAKYLLTVACGDDPHRWARAEASARRCLDARARLWDAVGELVLN